MDMNSTDKDLGDSMGEISLAGTASPSEATSSQHHLSGSSSTWDTRHGPAPPAYAEHEPMRQQGAGSSSERYEDRSLGPGTSTTAPRLPRAAFLAFLDGLNRVAVASPPLQILGLAGNALGLVPSGIAQIVGGAIDAAATLGTIVVSKGATGVSLRKANREIFGVRGLKVEVARLEALARVVGVPILDAAGRVRRDAALMRPIESLFEDGEEEGEGEEVEEGEEGGEEGAHTQTRTQTRPQTLSAQQRRLQALEPWIAPLELEALPPIDMEGAGALGRLHTAVSERQRARGESKVLKRRGKALEKGREDVRKAEREREKELAKLDREERKVREGKGRKEGKEGKEARKLEEKLAKIAREREEVERDYEKEMEKVDRGARKRDMEAKDMQKILWLVIRNLDAENVSGENPYVGGQV
ncbi:Uu.00g034360.m01.CDS01 [Anthostomella pinea]|uniref:Uu.00g034360.m01.CDS01 n=1 Tax=Anthostomella pinea TaxID=933095 RepID=A0AAI8YDH6_9PEZI|nr:Uu.00g034360.m01.CDS01 [Anthostomella pinea]